MTPADLERLADLVAERLSANLRRSRRPRCLMPRRLRAVLTWNATSSTATGQGSDRAASETVSKARIGSSGRTCSRRFHAPQAGGQR